MRFPQVTGPDKLERLVREIGFLPMFRCCIEGFSLEELTPARYWFNEGIAGPWEWREVLAESGRIAYGKLFCRKAGFVSLDWYPYFANYRRQGYDFDARWEDGLAPAREKRLVDALERSGPMLSYDLKGAAALEKGFDTALTSLQMQTYVTVRRFEYKVDRRGKQYGWGVGRYALSDAFFGAEVTRSAYGEEPRTSRQRILAQVLDLCPKADDRAAEKLIR